MPQEFAVLAERIVDALLSADPRLATMAGDHRADGELPDYSRGAITSRVAVLRDAGDALAQVDVETLDPEDIVDHAQLSSLIDQQLFDLTEVREHEWNPLLHSPGPLLYALISRDFAPAAERLEAVAERLSAIPEALSAARRILQDCPSVHREAALSQFAGVRSLIQDELPKLLAVAPESRPKLEVATRGALGALAEFAGWLRAGSSDPGRDPRLGRSMWEGRLWCTLDTELTSAELLKRAQQTLERVSAELAEACNGVPVREALAALGDQRPDNSTILDLARKYVVEANDFVAAHGFVSGVDDPLMVQEMPEFGRGVAVAYCQPPGALEVAEVPTFFAIAPTPSDWSPERVESFYREYNDHMVADLVVHEAMPGHFLQLAHSRRFRGSSPVRALCRSGPFVEGWAVYAEELMANAGFGGPGVKLTQLKMQLRVVINAILDQLVHCEDLSEADGMALMCERGFQEESEAAGKWRRALLTSTQLSTYFVGYTEIADIAAARPADITIRAWHDAMLAHGSPAPRHLRTLLGI